MLRCHFRRFRLRSRRFRRFRFLHFFVLLDELQHLQGTPLLLRSCVKAFVVVFFPKKSPKREIHSIEGSSRVDKTLKPANKKLHQFEVHVSCGTPPFKILFFADLTVFWMGSVVDKHLISLAVIHHIRYAYVSWNEVIETKPSLTYTISLGTEHIGGWFMSSEIIGLISSLQANSSVTCSRGIFVSHPLIGTSISIYTSSLKFQHKTDISPLHSHMSKQSSPETFHTCETDSPPNMSTKTNNSLNTHIFQAENVWKTTNSTTNLIATTHF